MKESKNYSDLRPHLAKLFAIDRVENAVMPGIPDCILSAKNKTLYTELKAEVGKRLRGSQVAWCLKRVEKKCVVDMFVVTRHHDDWVIFVMYDVANNAGLVSLSLDHVVCKNAEHVAETLYEYLDEIQGGLHDVRRRARASKS